MCRTDQYEGMLPEIVAMQGAGSDTIYASYSPNLDSRAIICEHRDKRL